MVRSLALVAALVVSAAVPSYAQVLVDVDPNAAGVQATQTLVIGESLQGYVMLWSGGQAVAGFDVELTFDSRVLRIREAQLVGIAAGAYEIVNSPVGGSLKIAVVRESAAQPSADAVVRLSFDAVGDGTTTVAIATSKISGASGSRIGLAAADASVTVRAASFINDPVIPGVTLVRAAHLQELRARIDQKRTARGLTPYRWSEPAPLVIRAVHLIEMRNALAAVYASAGRPAPSYTDPVIIGGQTPVRAVHINELRGATVAAP